MASFKDIGLGALAGSVLGPGGALTGGLLGGLGLGSRSGLGGFLFGPGADELQKRQRELALMRGDQLNQLVGQLQDRAAGKNLLSTEQLRQGLETASATQAGMAAGARPGQTGLATRTAAQNIGRLQQGFAGQQALAGIAEQQAAQGLLGNVLLGARGQELGGAEGARQADEQRRQNILGMIGTGAQLAGLMSDRSVKIDLADNPQAADRVIEAFSPKTFRRQEGGPEELGVVAQAVEQTPAGPSIVRRTSEGLRSLDIPRLVGAEAAAIGRLGERLDELESLLARGAGEKAGALRGQAGTKRRQAGRELSFARDRESLIDAEEDVFSDEAGEQLLQQRQAVERADRFRDQAQQLLDQATQLEERVKASREFTFRRGKERGRETLTAQQRDEADALSRRRRTDPLSPLPSPRFQGGRR